MLQIKVVTYASSKVEKREADEIGNLQKPKQAPLRLKNCAKSQINKNLAKMQQVDFKLR